VVKFKGHPSGISDALIEEQLKGVRLRPAFDDLPKELSKAARYLSDGKYGKGLEALEKEAEDPDHGAAAKEAIEKVTAYGRSQLELVEGYANGGSYAKAMDLLESLEGDWKDTGIGDQAKEKRSDWKKDKTVKAEIEAEKYIEKAEELLSAKNERAAAALLMKVTKGSKYEGTKARAKAEQMLARLTG
jgi:hypothetical protein